MKGQWPRHENAHGIMNETVDKRVLPLTSTILSDSIPVAQVPLWMSASGHRAYEGNTYTAIRRCIFPRHCSVYYHRGTKDVSTRAFPACISNKCR